MDQPHAFADPATSAHAARQPSLTDALRDWLRDLLQLAVLEGREAGAGLALMAGLGAAAAALLMTGWLALVGAGVAALAEQQILGWSGALGVAALLSFAVAGGLVFLLMRRSQDTLFRATRRQLCVLGAPPQAFAPTRIHAPEPDNE
ncbi:MAG: phage holin family protein [Comamonadaceae bacterium]|jgi:uncharacterized membrane protein YqjE|uniref:phage holin family protein n=1 Tax=Candidatus Skiveiella danica TaxID=3386177 RepID=UPI001B701428|nr:phage holin family protein [Comamonadaceae bacterium]MBK9198320.1 phage holin family protein [Betaproteobacteria bacterium]MBP8101519.1 phage holin family protein [Burkholderiaceae bacterium]HQD14375.1 phage holin family protein [Ottowia sp.]MBK6558673.1 phage holin family protein [Comamonadaceae bacterium]